MSKWTLIWLPLFSACVLSFGAFEGAPLNSNGSVYISIEKAAGFDQVISDPIGNTEVSEASVSNMADNVWTLPDLFFEAEEEAREHDEREGNDRRLLKKTGRLSLALKPLVFSISDHSSVVGRGRNFHTAPPLRLVLGVFRV